MACCKPIDTDPRFIAVDLASQLLPGTFEQALNHLLDHEIDRSGPDARYANDETGAPRDCLPCTQRERCLRTSGNSGTRQVPFVQGRAAGRRESFTARMQRAIDSPRAALCTAAASASWCRCPQTCAKKKLARFTLRARKKVEAQWKLFCMMHNTDKLAHQCVRNEAVRFRHVGRANGACRATRRVSK